MFTISMKENTGNKNYILDLLYKQLICMVKQFPMEPYQQPFLFTLQTFNLTQTNDYYDIHAMLSEKIHQIYNNLNEQTKMSFSYFIESWLVNCLLITKPLLYYNNN